MRSQHKKGGAEITLANLRGPLIAGLIVVIVVIAYFAYDLLRPACDSIFEQTTARLSAKIKALKTQEELTIGREQVQELTDSSQKVALHLKACCVAQVNGRISATQLQTCIDGAKNYEASVIQASAALQEAQAAHQQGNNQLEQEKLAQAAQSVGAATGAAQPLEKVATQISSGPAPSGPALDPVALQSGEIDLLAPAQGGHLLAAPRPDWEKVISGNETDMADAYPGDEGVFAFLDDKPAQFWKFALLVPSAYWDNIKDFELFAGNDSITGSFQSLGKFTTQNMVLILTPYQEFEVPKTTAKYFKVKVLSAHGNDWGRLKQIRLFGVPQK